MSFLEKDTVGSSKLFYFDGSRIFDALVQALTSIDNDGFNALEYNFNGDDPIKDKANISILKLELGTDYIEKQMYKQFTRNNNEGEENIKNHYQLNLYKDFVRTNNFLAAMFLYLFHKYTYDAWPDDYLLNSTDGINAHKRFETNGFSDSKIIQEIKTVYPFLHNLFVKLLEKRYGPAANIAIMKVQDAEEQLKESELTGQIQKIKGKKNPKIQLLKK
ncbi:hypothetical protein ABPG74_005756 [Tetrahymena malaccensis]